MLTRSCRAASRRERSTNAHRTRKARKLQQRSRSLASCRNAGHKRRSSSGVRHRGVSVWPCVVPPTWSRSHEYSSSSIVESPPPRDRGRAAHPDRGRIRSANDRSIQVARVGAHRLAVASPRKKKVSRARIGYSTVESVSRESCVARLKSVSERESSWAWATFNLSTSFGDTLTPEEPAAARGTQREDREPRASAVPRLSPRRRVSARISARARTPLTPFGDANSEDRRFRRFEEVIFFLRSRSERFARECRA